jgi:hypothetical protein
MQAQALWLLGKKEESRAVMQIYSGQDSFFAHQEEI